ncbi:MAG: exodeoxyribonuclease VII large subunit [Treponema sp.]|nr:exodeoxyribonuclease VII large subunit [Treponema sp.]
MTPSSNDDSILSVTQLTGLIKTLLEGSFPNIQLKGEISNYRPNASGHLYFVLKDSQSQISAVMFRGRAATLNFVPKDGLLVQVRGSVSVYGPRGNYQIIISSMTKAGAGDIMEMIEERKKKLAAEGLFDSSRKRQLPFFPQRIGIVTSPTGAAIRDILQITRRRNPKASAIVFPSIVQGEEAAPSIIRMIEIANAYSMCDVLIVGRGGGSLEDLLPFSDEGVVRAIAASEIPVISAVGHEIDWALSDFAADQRAPTPSAAAELAVPLLSDIEQSIEVSRNEMHESIQGKLEHLRLMLKTFTPESMELQFRHIEQPLSMRFDSARENLALNMQNLLQAKKVFVEQCTQTLNNCNPQTIFDRGYSMVTDEEGKVVRNAKSLLPGAKIRIRPAEGSISAEVLTVGE